MLMVACMPLALLAADAARQDAGLDDRPGERRLELGLPAQDLPRGRAHITAVQTQADTTDHRADVVLAEVRVGASSAALSAVEARVDTRKQSRSLDRGSAGMRLQDLPSVGHVFLPSSAGPTLSLRPSRVKPVNADWSRPGPLRTSAGTGQPAPYGASGVDINCAVIGFIDKAPTANLADPVANSQFPPR